jgi:hypothetical protein
MSVAKGGSSIVAPPAIALVEPVFGPRLVYAEREGVDKQGVAAIIGHHWRPDVSQSVVASRQWREAGTGDGTRGSRACAELTLLANGGNTAE